MGLHYSVVDMSLAAGLGSVTVKNATLNSAPTCEKQVAVRHCNGKDIWIVSHDYNSSNFRAYLLTSTGLNSGSVISAIGETIGNSTAGIISVIGHLKISPDGKKLACATYSNSVPASLGLGGFFLFDFDASSGIVSNSLTLNNASSAYGVEFSPDGTRLYGTTQLTTATTPYTLLQWNVCAASNAAIIASQYSLSLGTAYPSSSIQRAPDNKLYIARSGAQFLDVINSPNSLGSAIGYSAAGVSLAPKLSTQGLPNFVNPFTKQVPTAYNNTHACQSFSFTAPATATFGSGCNSTPYPPSGYLWDFGEPASGSANTSTLNNPQHIYSAVGTYTVRLIIQNPCTNDTLKQVVIVSAIGPIPSVSGPSVVCKGTKNSFTVSGGGTYQWSSNAGSSTASVVTLSPSSNTTYTVSATGSGCTFSKSFSVSVDPCTSLSSEGETSGIKLYPNPVNSELNIDSPSAAEIFIVDAKGALVLRTSVEPGKSSINLQDLRPGIYLLRAVNGMGQWKASLVKE